MQTHRSSATAPLFATFSRGFGWLIARGPVAWVLLAGLGFLLLTFLAVATLAVGAVALVTLALTRRPALRGGSARAEDPRVEVYTPRPRAGHDRDEFDLFLDARARAARDVTPRGPAA